MLALDGGNSKTDVALVGTDGTLLGSVRGTGVNSHYIGAEPTVLGLTDLVRQLAGDDFVLGLKEITLPDGVTRPYSVWLSGEYPRALDGLCKILSLDMRVLDPAWIAGEIRADRVDGGQRVRDRNPFVEDGVGIIDLAATRASKIAPE